jgi:hypothetical protein
MPDDNPLGERGRALEDEYFRRLDRARLDRARRTSALDDERDAITALTKLAAPDVWALQARGFTPDTLALLPLLPLVQVAWADGGVSDAERALIVQFARTRAIPEGSAADRQLAAWLAEQPRPEMVSDSSRLVGEMFERAAGVVDGLAADELMEYCERIATVSGGFLGLAPISVDERELLTRIAQALKIHAG